MDVPATGSAPDTTVEPAARTADGARRDVVAIGASAGGIDALKRLVGRLPQQSPDVLRSMLAGQKAALDTRVRVRCRTDNDRCPAYKSA